MVGSSFAMASTSVKVRLACPPHDPYTPAGYRGVTRVLGTIHGLKRFATMHESPYHGLNFCQGTIGAMLDDPAGEIFDVIRWFGDRGKLFNVHFRNIKGRQLDFMEVFPNEGDMDIGPLDRGLSRCRLSIHADAGPPAAD
jgi:mannonate dehydratase